MWRWGWRGRESACWVDAREIFVPRSCWLRLLRCLGLLILLVETISCLWHLLLSYTSVSYSSWGEWCSLRLRVVVFSCALLIECTSTIACFIRTSVALAFRYTRLRKPSHTSWLRRSQSSHKASSLHLANHTHHLATAISQRHGDRKTATYRMQNGTMRKLISCLRR